MKTLVNDPYNIKFRCFKSGRSMQQLADRVALKAGKCKLAALSRAMGAEMKTARDTELLQFADEVLKEWEAE